MKKVKILEELNRIAQLLPTPLYWLDINGVILGLNELTLQGAGATSSAEMVGKTPYDLYPYDLADRIIKHNQEVIKTRKILSQEETITDIITGQVRHYTAVKAPLFDENGEIIGAIGTSIDITAQKDAEKLKLENERLLLENKIHKMFQDEQARFKKVVDQVSHDIRSPLASILIFAKSAKHLPEEDRILLREAATRITDIANNLSIHYITNESSVLSEIEVREPLLVSAAIAQILSEKRLQYRGLPVKFEHEFSQEGNFAFINIEDNAFKRMLSNLINNSVEAFDNRPGYVDIRLECNSSQVRIIIQDNGKGMPQSIIDKIMRNIPVTDGKLDGSGIGLTQVRETLQRNDGDFEIESTIGQGTKIILTFPQIDSPGWFADRITLNAGDQVIVLDDDPSIHGAWKSRFAHDASEFTLKHFIDGHEAIDYINSKTQEEKQKIFLLSDFELLEQDIHGLQVIEQTAVKRSVLVTSHHNNKDVREMANKINTRILPKSLAVEVPIKINFVDIHSDQILQRVDLVIVDDDRRLAESLKLAFFSDRVVDIWVNPDEFINSYAKYPLDTKICLDNNFPGFDLNGIKLAEKLHAAGYTQLYLISGDKFDKRELPSYLNFILKTDIDSIEKLGK